MFGRGFKILTLFGIPVYLDISFFIIVPLFAWLLSQNLMAYAQMVGLADQTIEFFGVQPVDGQGQPVAEEQAVTFRMSRPGLALVFGVAVTLGLYLSVLIHEFGHALTARLYGVPTERVTLWFLGGIASFERMPRQPGAEAIVAIAGPLTSFAVAGLFALLAAFTSDGLYMWQLIVRSLAAVNLILAIFNLLPALPLDGGRVLRSLLALFMPYLRATSIAAAVSKLLALLLALSVFFTGSLMMVAIAIFIWLAVNAETRQSAVEELLRGVRVGDVMVRDVMTVRPETPAGALLEEMIRRRHLGFPVTDESGRVLGVIGLRDFPEGFDPNQPASSLMQTNFCHLSPDAPAMAAFEEMGRNNFGRCLVLRADGRLEGLVAKSDLMRLLQIRTAAMAASTHQLPRPAMDVAQNPGQ